MIVIAVSSLIALLLSLMDPEKGDLSAELLISNSIGVCIWLIVEALQALSRDRLALGFCMLISVPAGVILGAKAATLLGAPDLIGFWTQDPAHRWKSIGVTLLFASSATAFVILAWRAREYRLELEHERRRSAEASRAQLAAELGLLQAQIEPHFLFNTLAHVQSAIGQEPEVGKAMLDHLVQYLRGALSRSRVARYTLGEEIELVNSLLAIAVMRLGTRLSYRIAIPQAYLTAKLPPLLVQPLVENAIKHGIETSVQGGEIMITGESSVRRGSDETLLLRVVDSGVGLSAVAPEGVGLSNVRSRLAALYDGKGGLTLLRNEPRGLIAELRLPLEYF